MIIFDANFLCAPRIRVKRALWVSIDDYEPGGAAGRSRNWAASCLSGWRPPPSSSHSQRATSRTLRLPQGSHSCMCHIHARTRSCAGRWAAFLRLDRGNPSRCPPAGPGTGPGMVCSGTLSWPWEKAPSLEIDAGKVKAVSGQPLKESINQAAAPDDPRPPAPRPPDVAARVPSCTRAG